MSFTRDNIQGFIDGYIYAGGDPAAMDTAVSEWMNNHPIYRLDIKEKTAIQSDLVSYRIPARDAISPSSALKVVP